MKNLLTKKVITISSVVGAITLFTWDHVGNVKLCKLGSFGHWFFVEKLDWGCLDSLWTAELVFFLIIPLAFLSILTYKMRDEIFAAWISFAKWWVPLSMIAILIAPEVIKGSFSVPVKWPLAVFCSAILLLVSLILIAHKHFTLKTGGAGK